VTARPVAALVGALLLAAACSDDGPVEPEPSTTTLTGVAIDGLEPGACLVGLPGPSPGRVETVDCDLDHRAEVYAVHDLGDGPFPGAGPIDERAARGCAERYEAYAGEPIDPTTDRAFAELVPTQDSWGGGDRRVVCLALPPGGGSARGTIAAGEA
jgi:hypothetical protein